MSGIRTSFSQRLLRGASAALIAVGCAVHSADAAPCTCETADTCSEFPLCRPEPQPATLTLPVRNPLRIGGGQPEGSGTPAERLRAKGFFTPPSQPINRN
jgi:hypothetical protein